MPRPDKEAKVQMLREKFTGHTVIYFTDFTGLKVDEINSLRKRLGEAGAEYRVLKNTLARLALSGTDREEMAELLVGPVAAAFVSGDPVGVAKVLVDFSKEYPDLKLKGGYLEGRMISAADLRSVASLPPREVLLAKFMGALRSPLFGLHQVLSGPCRKLVFALQAVGEKKAQAA
jgi:large subunit ribosomal protein L10